jgi:hypothetical protein
MPASQAGVSGAKVVNLYVVRSDRQALKEKKAPMPDRGFLYFR